MAYRGQRRRYSSSEESDSDDEHSGYKSYPERRDKYRYQQDYRDPRRDPRRRHDGRYSDEDKRGRQSQNDRPRHGEEDNKDIAASDLVLVLANCPDMKETLLNLLEKAEMKPSVVRKLVSKAPSVFHLDGEVLALKPEISLCEEHIQDGCQSRNDCRRLHICDQYIAGDCHSRSCLMGHKWDTNHNISILKEYNLNSLPPLTLGKLIYEITLSQKPDGPLEVCIDYNKKDCSNMPCRQLHLCLSFVKNKNKCKTKNCTLNHDVLADSCLKLLPAYGISVNETPRDILDSILRINPSLINLSEVDNEPVIKKKKGKNVQQEKIVKESDTDESSDSKEDAKSNNHRKNQKTPYKDGLKQSNKMNNELGTIWFDYPNGDVNIPEICYYSVESLCKSESIGCDRLHSTQHFHWQISEYGDTWLNLTLPQIKSLELSYCKPEEEDVKLERLDPRDLDRSSRNLLLLMGRDKWEADFNAMTISNSTQSKVLKLRRLCTQTISGQDFDGNLISWYFKDKNQKWIEYGNIDSTGEEKLKAGVSSKDIEIHFQRDQEKPLSFKNASFNYSLDFINMTQTNTGTNVSREVRRRPAPHLSDDGDDQQKNAKISKVNLPSTWDPMQPNERVRMVDLQSSSSEYQTVVNIFGGNYNITKIERIQNPFHYRAFENKVQDMIAVYNNDLSKVDIRQIFHGTKSSVIKSICSENFDWRLHGTSTGNVWGKGTYFSPDVKLSYGYCQPDSSGLKYMFIARVAIGTMILGDSSMARPPINPATSMPYDATVNKMAGPTIIVKYDKQEYYPEYIVTLQ